MIVIAGFSFSFTMNLTENTSFEVSSNGGKVMEIIMIMINCLVGTTGSSGVCRTNDFACEHIRLFLMELTQRFESSKPHHYIYPHLLLIKFFNQFFVY